MTKTLSFSYLYKWNKMERLHKEMGDFIIQALSHLCLLSLYYLCPQILFFLFSFFIFYGATLLLIIKQHSD